MTIDTVVLYILNAEEEVEEHLTLTMARGHKVNARQNVLASFSHTLFN